MKKYAYLLIILAVIACKNDKSVPEIEVELSATIDDHSNSVNPAPRKISGRSNQETDEIDLVWSAEDALAVHIGEAIHKFTLIPNRGYENTKFARFKGMVPDTKPDFNVVFPYQTPDLTNQPYIENGFDYNLLQMSGIALASNDYAFTLEHTSSVFKIPLWSSNGETVKSVALSVSGIDKKYVVTSTNGVTLGETEEQSVNFNIVLDADALDWTKGIELTVVDKLNPNRMASFKAENFSSEDEGVFSPGYIVTCPSCELTFVYTQYDGIEMFYNVVDEQNCNYFFGEVNAGANSIDALGIGYKQSDISDDTKRTNVLKKTYNKNESRWQFPTKDLIEGMLGTTSNVVWTYEESAHKYKVVYNNASIIYIPVDESGNCNLWLLDGSNLKLLQKIDVEKTGNERAIYAESTTAETAGYIRPIYITIGKKPGNPDIGGKEPDYD